MKRLLPLLSLVALHPLFASTNVLEEPETLLVEERSFIDNIKVQVTRYSQVHQLSSYTLPGGGWVARARLHPLTALEINAGFSSLFFVSAVQLSASELAFIYKGCYVRAGAGAFSTVHFSPGSLPKLATSPFLPLSIGYQGSKMFIDAGVDLITPWGEISDTWAPVPTLRIGSAF